MEKCRQIRAASNGTSRDQEECFSAQLPLTTLTTFVTKGNACGMTKGNACGMTKGNACGTPNTGTIMSHFTGQLGKNELVPLTTLTPTLPSALKVLLV
jgi:hypothetical protein